MPPPADKRSLARLCLARDVVECPECGEPEPFLGLFLRQGKAGAVRLSRLEWVTHAPSEFVRWVVKVCPRWRRASEFFVNHCSSCGSPLADPLGFRGTRGWLSDTGIDVAVTAANRGLTVEGFSPGAIVIVDGGKGLWEEMLRVTPRDFRKRFKDPARFSAEGRSGIRLSLFTAPSPHRWRLVEAALRGRRPEVDQGFFSFSQAKDAARIRFGVAPSDWSPDH